MSFAFRYIYPIIAVILCSCTTDYKDVVRGTLTMGHEVRAFAPDGTGKEFWIIDKSGCLYKQYQKIAPVETGAYTPVRAELKVEELPKMQDGFGAEYDGTYEVVEIISLTPMKK